MRLNYSSIAKFIYSNLCLYWNLHFSSWVFSILGHIICSFKCYLKFKNVSSGVDDNGAGVAAMLEVAKQLTSMDLQGQKRKNTIFFVSFDHEESGKRYYNCSRIFLFIIFFDKRVLINI